MGERGLGHYMTSIGYQYFSSPLAGGSKNIRLTFSSPLSPGHSIQKTIQ